MKTVGAVIRSAHGSGNMKLEAPRPHQGVSEYICEPWGTPHAEGKNTDFIWGPLFTLLWVALGLFLLLSRRMSKLSGTELTNPPWENREAERSHCVLSTLSHRGQMVSLRVACKSESKPKLLFPPSPTPHRAYPTYAIPRPPALCARHC